VIGGIHTVWLPVAREVGRVVIWFSLGQLVLNSAACCSSLGSGGVHFSTAKRKGTVNKAAAG